MPNKHYRKGYVFELKVKHYLESLGLLVFRSAGSHSIADIIAFHSKEGEKPLFIQCKAGKASMTSGETTILYNKAVEYGAVSIIAYQNNKKRMVLKEIIKEKK